eukprot:9095321-Pyramimonas_sp.AAC.1
MASARRSESLMLLRYWAHTGDLDGPREGKQFGIPPLIDGLQDGPKRAPRGPQEGPKRTPRPSEKAPGGPHDPPEEPQD